MLDQFRFVLICLALVATPATAADAHRIRTLIVTGADHPAHDWRETTPALVEALERDPRIEARVIEEPEFLAAEAIHLYQVIVLHFMPWERPEPSVKARENVKRFVENGGGLFVLHFANTAFPTWDEYVKLAGRTWDRKNTHDPHGPFSVIVSGGDHPITKGLPSVYETRGDELYIGLAGDRPITVLAEAKSKLTGRLHPMAFAFDYGKGRVFHSTLGHSAEGIRVPNTAELFRRGCAWAAGASPTP